MADVRREPIKWRRHRSWGTYAWLTAGIASLAIAAQWLIGGI